MKSIALAAAAALVGAPALAFDPLSVPPPPPPPPAQVLQRDTLDKQLALGPGACLRGPLTLKDADGFPVLIVPPRADYPQGCSAWPSIGGLGKL